MATNESPKPEVSEPADVTPLSAADILELDYDDDAPTRVADRSHASDRPSMFPPPRVDQNDVFMLTDLRRPSLALVDESSDVIDFNDVLRAPPRLPDFSAPLPRPSAPPMFRTESMSSIAPVAMSAEDTGKRHVPRDASLGRAHYGLGLGFLAGVALAIAVWPSGDPAPVVLTAAQPIQTQETVVVADEPRDPVIHTLDTIEIEASPARGPVLRAVAQNALSTVAAGTEADLIDEPAEAAKPIAPPAPELPVFDRAAANAAINAAAASATSCRTDGSPRLPGRIAVTFAPSGRVTTAVVDGATYAGSTVGGCIAKTFRSVRVEPFSGAHVTVHKTYTF